MVKDIVKHFYTTDFYCKITNLKTSYTNNENPSFRLYTRPRDWNPNIFKIQDYSESDLIQPLPVAGFVNINDVENKKIEPNKEEDKII